MLFDLIDPNDDFKLSFAEFSNSRDTLAEWGLNVSDFEKEWTIADKNGSGSITFDEFVELALNLRKNQ